MLCRNILWKVLLSMKLRNYALAWLVLWLMAAWAQAASVRFLVLDARAMPFSQFKKGPSGELELGSGIIKDWQDALAAELGRTPVNLYYSRMRQDQAVAAGKVDLRCFVSPSWMSRQLRANYDWPAPYMSIEERLAGPADKPLINSTDDLRGKTLGMVFGYYYPNLQPLFELGLIQQDNAPNEVAVLKKQLAGRTDYMATRTLDFQYQRKHNPALRALVLSPLVISHTALHCARPKNSSLPFKELTQAQERLLKAGVMDKILARYR